MKIVKYVVSFILSAFIILMLTFLIVNFYVFQSSSICESDYIMSYLDKVELIQNAPSPRIIFVGDSNLTLTLDSAKIADEFGYNPVNMSISAMTGLRYDLESIRTYIKASDVVVISGAFGHFLINSGIFDGGPHPMLWGLLITRPSDIRYLTSWKQVSLVINTNIDEVKKRLNSPNFFDPDCISLGAKNQSRDEFNQYGDYIGHLDKGSTGKNYKNTRLKSSQLDPESIAYLNDFANYVQDRGAVFLLAHPAHANQFWINSEKELLDFENNIHQQYEFPIIGHLRDYALPDDQLYNTDHHGTAEGRANRTKQLIEDIRPYLTTE